MKFKMPKLQKQWLEIPSILQVIVLDFAEQALVFGKEIIVTRVSDHVEGSSGVHEEKRGVDVRDEFLGKFMFTDGQRQYLLDYINRKYPRYDGKQTVMWHSFQHGPHHFHFQVAETMDIYMKPISG